MTTQGYFSLPFKLPPALKEKENVKLLEKMPDKEARELLIKGNLRLVAYIAKKYSNSEDIEDLFSIGTIGLIKAIDKYELEKNIKLSSFASRCIENEILMYFRKENKMKNTISINKPIDIDKYEEELYIEDICEDYKATKKFDIIENTEILLYLLNNFSNILLEKSFRDFIIFLYFLAKEKQKYVGKVVGLARSYISRINIRFKKEITELSKTQSYSVKLTNPNIIFDFKDNVLYIKISKRIICNEGFGLLPFNESEEAYFLALPFERESFFEIAEIFRYIYYWNNICE